MSAVNPFAPGSDNAANHEAQYQEVNFRGTRSSSTTKQGLPSETDSLLGNRRTPPPRYSSVDSLPQQQTATTDGNLAAVHDSATVTRPTHTHVFSQPQNQNVIGPTSQPAMHPGWYPWIPGGHGQFFPPGLEHLNGVDLVTITGRGNKYRIFRGESNQIFTARIISQGCCGRRRDDDASIRVLNNANLEVLSISRTLDSVGCCRSSNEHLEISFPPGTIVGVVQGCKAEYTVHNPSGDLLFIIEQQRGGCCRNGGYEIVSPDRYPVGCIATDKSCCGTSKIVRIAFPQDLDLRSKALLLSAALSFRVLRRV